MEFYSLTNKPPRSPYPKSHKIMPTYSLKIDKQTGKKELKETGKTDIYERIQESKESTMIYNILERFLAGDNEIINKQIGSYGDFTELPTNLAEAQQLIIDAENTFKSLPLDIRKEFNHSPTEFMAGIENGKLEKILIEKGLKEKPQETKVEQQPLQGQQTIEGAIKDVTI